MAYYGVAAPGKEVPDPRTYAATLIHAMDLAEQYFRGRGRRLRAWEELQAGGYRMMVNQWKPMGLVQRGQQEPEKPFSLG